MNTRSGRRALPGEESETLIGVVFDVIFEAWENSPRKWVRVTHEIFMWCLAIFYFGLLVVLPIWLFIQLASQYGQS